MAHHYSYLHATMAITATGPRLMGNCASLLVLCSWCLGGAVRDTLRVVGAGAAAIFGFWHRQVYALGLVAFAGVRIGVCHGSVASNGLEVYCPLIGTQLQLSGRIKEDPSLTAKKLGSTAARPRSLQRARSARCGLGKCTRPS